MKERIESAAKAGCHAVDPDNIDGYVSHALIDSILETIQELTISQDVNQGSTIHQDGFTYDKSVYADYVKYLATIAKANNLAIGLKNAQAIIPDVIDVIQFAVNEQCHENKECAAYKPLTSANLAVFNIE
jgi:methyl coenzyme M reductase subunit D